MEKYLPEIYSKFLKYDPLSNVDFTETYTREIVGNTNTDGKGNTTNTTNSSGNSNSTSNSLSNNNSSSSSNNNNSSLKVDSVTPQSQISKSQILEGKYASNTSAQESSTSQNDETSSENSSEITDTTNISNESTANSDFSNSSKSDSKTIEKFTRHEEGDNGVIITNQRLVKEYREIISATDTKIINDLNILFMGLF